MIYDVAIPEMGLNNLTYQSPAEIPTGLRVWVEVQKNLHVGFILGKSKQNIVPEIEIKEIEALVDGYSPVITPDLWDMALYAGHVCLCGAAMALKAILPRPLIMGDKITEPPKIFEINPKNFREDDRFNPFDSERINFFLNDLRLGERTLILFSNKASAKNFFDSLPDELKHRALLWSSNGSKKYWLSWLQVQEGKFDFVIGTAGAVFAPLVPQKIIIEDEASPNYFIPPVLNISARSLAGRRAAFTGAKLIIGGRLPSLKTFIRSKPEETIFPERSNIILADIFHRKTIEEETKGIEGHIPLTYSLIRHTNIELMNKNSVIWILDRLGESSEVFCSRCGESVKCSECGTPMRSENEGKTLRCRVCGKTQELPPKCEKCGFEILKGRKPGLEALEKIAGKYYNKISLYYDKYTRVKKNSLILSTRRGLELCEKIQPSLIAWLDLDFELWYPGHNTRLDVFSMLWESYWRGRTRDKTRKILIQSRKQGLTLAKFLPQGWQKFFPNELDKRKEFNLPPFGYLIELMPQKSELREKILNSLFEAGIFVMDPGDETLSLNIKANSLEPIEKILASLRLAPKDLKITLQN